MTDETLKLFEILKLSLWSHEKLNETVSDAVAAELRAQCVDGLAIPVIPSMDSGKYLRASQFVQMAYVQSEAVNVLNRASIPAAVIKGTAAGIYYPQPYLRVYGDIDLIVHPDHYRPAIQALSKAGFIWDGEVGTDETPLIRNGFLVELHQSPPGLTRVKEGGFILDYIRSGLDGIMTARIENPSCVFPMLPWPQNGLEIIWHIREHLYNGLGLKQIIDWMMFVDRCLKTDDAYAQFRSVLEKAGLITLANTITRMCQMYLGLDGHIAWCADADEVLCENLMNDILEQGNFGHKKTDDKAAKVLTRYVRPIAFLKGMQQKGLNEWPAIRKYPFLRPFAWLHTGVQGVREYLIGGRRKQLVHDIRTGRRRRDLFERIYGGGRDAGPRAAREPFRRRN